MSFEDEEDQQPEISHSRSNGKSHSAIGHRQGNGRGHRVYQEYLELLGAAEEPDSTNDASAGSLVLDVNLISSLTRWAVVAKQRVDGQRLDQILDLYAELGHLTPDLRGLLTKIIDLIEENPLESAPVPSVPKVGASANQPQFINADQLNGAQLKVNADAESCIDLILHLHGILAGSPVIRPVTATKVANPVT